MSCQIALADGQSIAKEPLEFEDFVLWPKRSSKMVCFWLKKWEFTEFTMKNGDCSDFMVIYPVVKRG
jgi:hypothetical protein